jgi:hypothetical protein
MVADLGDFTDQDTDEQDQTGPELDLYTAGSGNGDWAYVIDGPDPDKNKRDSYSGDAKRGFIPQLKAVVEGTERVNDEYSNAEVTIYTPSESIVGLMEGDNKPNPDYRKLYRTAKKNYNDNWGRWDVEHLSRGSDNPARDLI